MVWRTATALAALLLAATHGQMDWFPGSRDERGAGQPGMAMAAVVAIVAGYIAATELAKRLYFRPRPVPKG